MHIPSFKPLRWPLRACYVLSLPYLTNTVPHPLCRPLSYNTRSFPFPRILPFPLSLEIALKKEARTAQHNSASAGGFHSDDFCEKFKAAFEERDSVVANISSDLEGLCTIVDDINHKTKELAPPRTAQVGAEGGGGGGSGGGGGGTAPSKQRGT